MTEVAKTEFRVREIKRYVVTRYDESNTGRTGTSTEKGTYDNYEIAFEVAYALAQAETEKLGLAPDDARVQYPQKYDPCGVIQGQTLADLLAESEATASVAQPSSLPGHLGDEYTDAQLVDAQQRMYQARELNYHDMQAVSAFLAGLRERRKQGNLFA